MLCLSKWRNSSSQKKKNAQMRVRSLAGAVRLSMRGKSCSITPTLKMAADGSGAEELTFLGSELHGDGPAESPSGAFKEVPVRDETAVGVEPFHPRQSPESVEGHGGAPSKTLTTAKKRRVNISTHYLNQIHNGWTIQNKVENKHALYNCQQIL